MACPACSRLSEPHLMCWTNLKKTICNVYSPGSKEVVEPVTAAYKDYVFVEIAFNKNASAVLPKVKR